MALPESELFVTPEAYLTVERDSEERHEYLDGFVYAMAGESEEHGTITTNLAMTVATRLKGSECRAFLKDMKVRGGPTPLDKRRPRDFFFYPDLVVVCGEREYHDRHRDVLLNPRVIIEVLSKSTSNFDRGEKFLRYRTWLPSLTDYLLVEQTEPLVEHYARESEHVWRLTEYRGLEQEVTISSINCALPLTEIYDRIVFLSPSEEEETEEAEKDNRQDEQD